MEKTIKLKTIKPTAIINIEVGAGFYKRVQDLFFWYVKQDEEKAIKAIENLKTQDPQDIFENHLLTLISLIYEIEQKANDQSFIEDTDFPIPQS